MQYLTCLRCGHKWLQRTEKPLCCPKCKSRVWNKPKKKELEVRGEAE